MKLKSNLERLKVEKDTKRKPYNTSYQVRSEENYTENGRLLKRGCTKTIDTAENMAQFKVSDFALENIIEVGALDSLKTMQLSHTTLENQNIVDDALLDMNIFEDLNLVDEK